MFSDVFLPTFPYLEIPMYNELVSRGADVQYVLQDGDIRLNDPVFASLRGLSVVKKPKAIGSMLQRGDILLSRFAYKLKAGDVAAAVRTRGNKILMYDPSGIDIRVRACPAQYLTAKSKKLKKATQKKFPKQYGGIFVTGTIHCDAAATTEVDRDDFMKSYGLDSSKKLAILTPANPGEAWMPGIQDDYIKIVNTIQTKCPGYELLVKAHPLDHTASMTARPGIIHKSQHYGGKHSWEKFAPGIKVVRAPEGYMALKACDVVINIRSSLAMEIPLFVKPVVNVNRKNYLVNWPFDDKIMTDTTTKNLACDLNDSNYKIPNEEDCLSYTERENYSSDGKAYVRTSNIAIKILEGSL